MRNIATLAVLLPLFAFAQLGANSDCAHAIALPVASSNVQAYFTTVHGNLLPSAPPEPVTACSGSSNHGSAWFSFVATSSVHWVRSEGDAMDESGLEVFSGTCGSLNSLQCIPSNSTTPAITGLSPGTTYFIRVVTNDPATCTGGQCQLAIAVVSAPTNDECAGAVQLAVRSSEGYVLPGTEMSTLGASQSQPACIGGATAANDDVWYRFTATASTHFLPTTVLSGEEPTVQWFSGACGSLTSIACDADAATGLAAGQEYHVRIHSPSTSTTVSSRVVGDVYTPAPNDECADALTLAVTSTGEQPVPLLLSTLVGTASTVPCGSQARDVWTKFTAPGTEITLAVSASVNAALFSGSCGSLSCVLQGSVSASQVYSGLTPGDTYFLKIGSSVASVRNVTIWSFASPTNDECTAPVDLTVQNNNVVYTKGYSYGATQSLPQNCGGTPNDVWYRFTATNAKQRVELMRDVTGGTMKLELFSGSCGSLTSVYCGTATVLPTTLEGLVPGSTYFMRLYGVATAFTIAVREAGAVNDECTGAIALPFSQLADFVSITAMTNVDAADGTGSCQTDRDVWFTFTAAHATASFCVPELNGSINGIELLSGTCGSLTSLSCQSNLTFARARFSGLTVGTPYFIRLSTFYQNGFRPMLLDQPVNDNITGAIDVPVAGASFAQPLFQAQDYAATKSYGHWCGPAAGPDDDTWFHFVATSTAHTITARPYNHYFVEPALSYPHLHVQLFDTLSTDSTVLAQNMVGCGEDLFSATGLVVGHDYWYRAYTVGTGATQVSAFLTGVSSGNNDEATGAATLSYGTEYSHVFTTSGATQSMPGANCSVSDFADDDIWFKFTATDQPARVVAGYGDADITLEVFSGTPGNLTSVSCSDNILVLPALTNGQTYYVRLYSWKNATPVSGRIGLFITPALTANTCVDETCLGPVLLENPSIEQGENCLVYVGDVDATEGLGTLIAPGWPRMQSGSSDGHSSCANWNTSNEVPSAGYFSSTERLLSRSGKGMGGLYVKFINGFDYSEYIQAALTEPLIVGEPYLVSFHAANLPQNQLCLNRIGAFLSTGPLSGQGYQPITSIVPQIEHPDIICGTEWVNICGVIVPDAPFDHITIGAFHGAGGFLISGNPINTAYYFIDDVVVARVTDPGCVMGLGDVTPQEQSGAGTGADGLRVYPIPASDRLQIVCDGDLFGKHGVIEVFDATGKRVLVKEEASLMTVQQLDLEAITSEGLYLVQVRVAGQAPKHARFLIKH